MINQIAIYERSRAVGMYVVENKSTVRDAAKIFNVSKTTIHNDLTKRLDENSYLYKQVRKVLDTNNEEKSIRGGESTKQKYLTKKAIE